VQPDRLALALRPRVGWEALDLGFQMAREWWKPVWAVWFCVYLPVAALCFFFLSNKLHAVIVLWWLKPVFDRAVLHTVSRAVFGEPQGVLSTLRAMRQWLLPGLLDSLLFTRLSLARSFVLPIAQLERQRGKSARKRQAALGSRTRHFGVWLTLTCVHIEVIALFGLAALADLLDPTMGIPDSDDGGMSFWDAVTSVGTWDGFYYVAAVSLVEPFYVTAGFALYLNRRAILEGWDIELALRRLEERLRTAASTAPALVLAAVLLGCLFAQPRIAHADEVPPKSASREIKAVLDSPEFARYKDVERWHYLGSDSPAKTDARRLALWRQLSELFASIAEAALWIAAIAILCVALYYLRRFVPDLRLVPKARYRPPDALFGFELAPESLPDDVAAAAAALARDGRLREALSLLYRGALSALVHGHRLALGPGYTEGDCSRAVGAALPASAEYFARLIGAWQSAAYAARAPDTDEVARLCGEWPPHFAAAPPA
jgi:hypothetical protein